MLVCRCVCGFTCGAALRRGGEQQQLPLESVGPMLTADERAHHLKSVQVRKQQQEGVEDVALLVSVARTFMTPTAQSLVR